MTVPYITPKMGYLMTAATIQQLPDDDERAAAAWFMEQENAELIQPSQLADLDANIYPVLWIEIDRVGLPLGWENLPAEITFDETIAALRQYSANGGSLYLSNMATQLTVPLGFVPSTMPPTTYGNGEGGTGTDVWTINPYLGWDFRNGSIDDISIWNEAKSLDEIQTWQPEHEPDLDILASRFADDFRDPYFFRNGDNAYIIVGSSKNGVGTTTLHRYNPLTGMWSNDGDLFFTGSSAAEAGTFWEMPNITPMPDGRWLFTVTPLNTSQGVHTLYWTGSIAADGKFVPDADSSQPRLVELNSRDGFGLLSPTIYRHNDKVIALGIVPDKLSSVSNWNLGWAHCYSLPREWSIAEDGSLSQKPYEGLTGLRTTTTFTRTGFDLNGTLDLSPVSGRSVEICGTFEVGASDFGFHIFKSGSAEAVVSYTPATGELVADFSALPRLTNDAGVYDGVYRCILPERPAVGSELKINIFIDHSILDIFVNDKWATSIRVFPTEADANGIEAFASATTRVKELNAWILEGQSASSGIESVVSDRVDSGSARVDVFNLQGMKVRANVPREVAAEILPNGFYIIGGQKVLVR